MQTWCQKHHCHIPASAQVEKPLHSLCPVFLFASTCYKASSVSVNTQTQYPSSPHRICLLLQFIVTYRKDISTCTQNTQIASHILLMAWVLSLMARDRELRLAPAPHQIRLSIFQSAPSCAGLANALSYYRCIMDM